VATLQYMDTIGIRELQQGASAAVRRVRAGETLGVTHRGRLVAVLAPSSLATGGEALLASSRVQPARRRAESLAIPVAAARPTADVLSELRDER
jgi:antitoxin (DNA-binding transcriptional repressor) of toxin-antitoxin stability system